jgi:hypothetical protein
VQPLLEKALAVEGTDAVANEMAVTAQGVLAAAHVLAGRFTLVATNVPYLGRGKQDDTLKEYCERVHPAAKADLATCFVERCLTFCSEAGSVGLVTPQNWLFLGTYRALREQLLKKQSWSVVTRLGRNAFSDMNWWAANTALLVLTHLAPTHAQTFVGLDVSEQRYPATKADALRHSHTDHAEQMGQLKNPDSRIAAGARDSDLHLLSSFARPGKGSTTGDSPHYHRCHWELPALAAEMVPWLNSPTAGDLWSGRHLVLLVRVDDPGLSKEKGCWIRGQEAWGHAGIAVSKMNHLRPFLYAGEVFDDNIGVLCPADETLVPAILCYCESIEYARNIRSIDQKVNVTAATLAMVPFDPARWRAIGEERYPGGVPRPSSQDPTQWLFNGHPKGSEAPLQVAIARLLGYRWPRQTGSAFPDCPALGPDGLERHAEEDGIVCLAPLRGDVSAADRLRALLADAFGSKWSAAKQNELLAAVGYDGRSLDEWLREGFFEQHCALFHQRPFVWHVWDGLRNGFGALVNYHKLAAPGGEGRRTFEKLVFTYLGDWIDRQRADQKAGVEGADGRVAAAEHLKREFERILAGDPPYDLFVRWKPLPAQPIGWEPDIDDGVRLNVRPFVQAKPLGARGKNACILRVTPKIRWDKDRGKEPARPQQDFPWFWGWDGRAANFAGGKDFDGNRWNDLHYTRSVKLAARERAKGGTGG